MVLVFKTNLNENLEKKVRNILSPLKEIDTVDFDFEDCDNVLRIVAKENVVSNVESLLLSKGIYCKEL